MKNNPKPSQEELAKMFTYFSKPELIKTGQFYRFWSTGRITFHNFMYVEEIEPRISEINIIILPETNNAENDSITTTFLQALELRELLLIECRQKGLLKENETSLPKAVITLPEKCELCQHPIEGQFYKGHVRLDGPIRNLCKNCGEHYGFCEQSVSSNNH